MTKQTVAAVWRGGADIALEWVPVPDLKPGEVLVRVRLATICGSDRHTVAGRRSQPYPSILGHEAVGEIVALGDSTARGDSTAHAVDGRTLQLGQRVIWSVTLPCGSCDRCRNGVSAKCRSLRKTGHQALNSGWALSGAYAQHVLLPAGMPIAVVDDELPDLLAAPAGCATATVMAVFDRVPDLAVRRVAVIGAGMLGLTAIAAARSAQAAVVVSIDPDAGRRDLARRFGATDALASIEGAGNFDVLLEFSGSPAALEDGIRTLDVQGVAVLAGSVTPAGEISLDPELVVRRHLSICGVHNYEPRHLLSALEFLRHTRDRYPWEQLVADPAPLDGIAPLLRSAPGTKPRYSVDPRSTTPIRTSIHELVAEPELVEGR